MHDTQPRPAPRCPIEASVHLGYLGLAAKARDRGHDKEAARLYAEAAKTAPRPWDHEAIRAALRAEAARIARG